MVDWLAGWLAGWLADWLTDLLTVWLPQAPQMPFWSETKRTINPTSHGMAQWDKTIMSESTRLRCVSHCVSHCVAPSLTFESVQTCHQFPMPLLLPPLPPYLPSSPEMLLFLCSSASFSVFATLLPTDTCTVCLPLCLLYTTALRVSLCVRSRAVVHRHCNSL